MEDVQRIDINYAGKDLRFEVWRFDEQTHFEAALYKTGVRKLPVGTASLVIGYKDQGNEIGRMFLLDKSIAAMAREASHMAFVAAATVNWDRSSSGFEDAHSELVGIITAALYSKSKYY